MKSIVALLLCLVSVGASSTNSRGYLVDASCFQSEERNVNPDAINLPGGHDVEFEVRACYPRAGKTRTFMVVLDSGEILALDAAGNTQAAKLVDAKGKSKGRRDRFAVNIAGTISDQTLHVESISLAK